MDHGLVQQSSGDWIPKFKDAVFWASFIWFASSMSVAGVRREKAALSSGCKSHPATAPAGSNRSSYGGNESGQAFAKRVTKYGDSASVETVTRVNAEQTSKRTMRRPT